MAINKDYLNAYLPACHSYGFEGGPTYSTQVVTLMNGSERRNATWDQPRHQYTTNFNNISKSSAQSLKQMFMVCRGQATAFRFQDPLDNEALNEDFAVGNGSTNSFQLAKVSIIDGVQYFRYIYAVRNINIYINDILQTAGVTVDLNRGIVNFTTPPADGSIISWSGGFDIWVRFNTDVFAFTLDNPDATNGQLVLIEVKAPEL